MTKLVNFDEKSSKNSEIQKTKSVISFFKLTWTHYIFLMRIDDEKERRFYEIEKYSRLTSINRNKFEGRFGCC